MSYINFAATPWQYSPDPSLNVTHALTGMVGKAACDLLAATALPDVV